MSQTVAELRAEAKKAGHKGYSKLTKPELIELLKTSPPKKAGKKKSSKLGFPENPMSRVVEGFGYQMLPFGFPCERPEKESYRRIEKWWTRVQLTHPEVPFEKVTRPSDVNEIVSSKFSFYSKSTRFDTLSPLTRLIIELAISDMKKAPDRLERQVWPTGHQTNVWVQGPQTIRIEYDVRSKKFVSLYTYVHLTPSLKFDSYEYYANLK